jgi:hypothetical protein
MRRELAWLLWSDPEVNYELISLGMVLQVEPCLVEVFFLSEKTSFSDSVRSKECLSLRVASIFVEVIYKVKNKNFFIMKGNFDENSVMQIKN